MTDVALPVMRDLDGRALWSTEYVTHASMELALRIVVHSLAHFDTPDTPPHESRPHCYLLSRPSVAVPVPNSHSTCPDVLRAHHRKYRCRVLPLSPIVNMGSRVY